MTRRQISPEELEHMYRLIGKPIWSLQYLEVAIDQFLTLKVDIQVPGPRHPADGYRRELLTHNRQKPLLHFRL